MAMLIINPISKKYSYGILVPHPFPMQKNRVKLFPKKISIGEGGAYSS